MGPEFYRLVVDFISALTPAQRWKAAGRQLNTAFMAEPWFICTAGGALLILTCLLLIVSLQRRRQRQNAAHQLFFDNAQRIGLSPRECRLLLDVANKAGLERSEDIFTMEIAFDREAVKMVEETRARSKDEQKSEQLRTEIAFLREKLGFTKQKSSSIGAPARSRNLSSRQIPVGRKVSITRRTARDSGDIEATVVENTDTELTVKAAMSVRITFGEMWRVRYYFGASTWEFDTTIVGCDGDTLVLNHSDTVRFINRRRFLRVAVNKPAFVAIFPFTRPLYEDNNGGSWRPPEFVPAVVTELAGPGLRINVPLDVKVGSRVLVAVRLDGENGRNSTPAPRDSKSQTAKIAQDIAEVRHTRVEQNGLSIAVELTGLSDSDLNELIRATNLASLRAGGNGQYAPPQVSENQDVAEPAPVQGV
jgi:hypothetical protein